MTDILLHFGLSVISGDISQAMMSAIDDELKANPNYVKEMLIDAANLPFKDNSFDLLLNVRLMHRVDASTRRKIIKEAHRVAKQYYIVSFGICNSWHSFRLHLKKKLGKGDSSPGRVPLKNLKKELKAASFTIAKKRSVFPLFSNEIIFC